MGATELVANVDRIEEIQTHSREKEGADWAGAARVIEGARASLAYNVAPEAILEVTLSRTRRKIVGTSLPRSFPGS